MAITFRLAKEHNIPQLDALVLRSKSSWGYSPEMLEAFAKDLALTEARIKCGRTWIGYFNKNLAGLVGLSSKKPNELEYLFVDPNQMKQGIGKELFKKAVDEAKKLGWKKFEIISDPGAQPFYKKMGATQIGEVASPIRIRHFLRRAKTIEYSG